jgi:hypothetical protein
MKIKYADAGRRPENKMRDKYRFVLLMRASNFRSVTKTISIPKDLGH